MTGSGRFTRLMCGAALLLGTLGAPLAAQESEAGDSAAATPPFDLYLTGGWSRLDLDGLNARLGSLTRAYTTFPEDVVTIGFGGHRTFRHVVLGIELSALLATSHADRADDRRGTLSGFWGALMIGYPLVNGRALHLYPLVEGGGAGTSLQVVRRDSPSWDDVLDLPGVKTTLTAGTVFGAAGLGADYRFRNGLLIGARGTWNFTPSTDSWRADGVEVLGGPDVRLSGPQVRLLVGWHVGRRADVRGRAGTSPRASSSSRRR